MKILILTNHDGGLYCFRKELIQQLLQERHEIYLSLPKGDHIAELIAMGCKFINTPLERRGTNPFVDMKLFYHYIKILRRIQPECVITYTIKPNLYGSIVANLYHIPFINTITGLGTSFAKESVLKKVIVRLYRYALRNSDCVFFQNKTNWETFDALKIQGKKRRLVSGSGVNLNQHVAEPYPQENPICFLFVGRVMKEKGIEEYVEVARIIKRDTKNVEFHIIGFCEDGYQDKIEQWKAEQIIIYHGMQNNVHAFMKKAHCIVHPSYHEGMSNVLLEAAACARPVIASRIPGCEETFDDMVSGYGIEIKNTVDLIEKIKRFLSLSYEEKRQMGQNGRKKIEQEFDRQNVVAGYMEEIQAIEQAIN